MSVLQSRRAAQSRLRWQTWLLRRTAGGHRGTCSLQEAGGGWVGGWASKSGGQCAGLAAAATAPHNVINSLQRKGVWKAGHAGKGLCRGAGATVSWQAAAHRGWTPARRSGWPPTVLGRTAAGSWPWPVGGGEGEKLVVKGDGCQYIDREAKQAPFACHTGTGPGRHRRGCTVGISDSSAQHTVSSVCC